MKYHNKNPKLRERWTSVDIIPSRGWENPKAWCQRHPSKFRFYGNYDRWWFEDKEDALIFKLRWGYNAV